MSHETGSESRHRHHRDAPRAIGCAVLTVSDTRGPETDTGGDALVAGLEAAGHRVVRRALVRDEVAAIRSAAEAALADPAVQALVVTGGTGVAPRDVTPEALGPLLDKPLPGFGELFRWLSYQEIGSAALASRAFAGLCGAKPLVALPGSRGALRLALEKLLLPELGHLVGEGARSAEPPAPAHQGGPRGGR